jgi:RNA polymerase sigma-70 factor, ECF subfamily
MKPPEPPTNLGDPATFRRVYEQHHAELVAVAWRVLHDQAAAEDVVQDVFVNVWLHPDSYDGARGSVRGYLTMIVRHRALDRWRSRVVAGAAAARLAARAATDGYSADSPADSVIRMETARAVRNAVNGLPHSQRQAILLAYGSGLSVPEVATATGAPLGTAKSRVRLGLAGAQKALLAAGTA